MRDFQPERLDLRRVVADATADYRRSERSEHQPILFAVCAWDAGCEKHQYDRCPDKDHLCQMRKRVEYVVPRQHCSDRHYC